MTEPPARICANHRDYVAELACPRCGTFACKWCIRGGLCVACDQQPAVHEARVKTAARWVALVTFVFVGLVIAEAMTALDDDVAVADMLLGSAMLASPFVVLGGVQLFVRAAVPGILAGAYALLGIAVMIFGRILDPLTLLWAVTFVALYSTVRRLREKRRAWHEAIAARRFG